MPSNYNVNTFLGAAVLGVISAAGMFLVQQYRQEKVRHAIARDLARLDHELAQVRRELDHLLAQKREKSSKIKRSRHVNKANSVMSSSTTDDYFSTSGLDSSDMEFYDVSEDEPNTSTSDLEYLLKEIDIQLETGSFSELQNTLKKLEDLCIEHPENPELLWRIGKAHHKISELSDDKEFIQEHIFKGIEACSLALQLNPDSGEIHKWYAILVGSRNGFVSLQEKICDGHLFKKHVDAALALNPNDPSLHHMLGRFNFEVAGLKWYERKVAAALFSEPPTATYPDALTHFIAAEELANFEWKENKLMIAKCKLATRDYEEGVAWLLKANNCKQGDGLDDKIDSEVKALLEKYNTYR